MKYSPLKTRLLQCQHTTRIVLRGIVSFVILMMAAFGTENTRIIMFIFLATITPYLSDNKLDRITTHITPHRSFL